jgi:hypothetical protein
MAIITNPLLKEALKKQIPQQDYLTSWSIEGIFIKHKMQLQVDIILYILLAVYINTYISRTRKPPGRQKSASIINPTVLCKILRRVDSDYFKNYKIKGSVLKAQE